MIKSIIPIVIIPLIFALNSCNQDRKQQKQKLKSYGFKELLEIGQKPIKDIDSLKLVSDLLNKELLHQKEKGFILLKDTIDYNNNKVYQKITFTRNVDLLPDIYVFSVCILNKDTLVIDGMNKAFQDVKSLYYSFYLEMINKEYTKKSLNDTLLSFSTTSYQINTILGVNLQTKKILSQNEWKLFFNSLKSINEVNVSIRNELAEKYADKQFIDLTPSQKASIVKHMNFSIVLSFELPCIMNSLPPRASITDSIFNFDR